jgi:ribonuclease P protein component
MLKKNVLRKKSDFSALYNKGKSVKGKCLILIYRKNGLTYNRKAFLASKKVGNSVKRNRARRLMKESFRILENDVQTGYDILFVARYNIIYVKCNDVRNAMETALNKARLTG